jgi:hypothetical protein
MLHDKLDVIIPVSPIMDDFIWILTGFDNGIYGLISAFPTVAPFAFWGTHYVFYGLIDFINEKGFHGNESLICKGDMMPLITEKHAEVGESHVYEDIMQLVDRAGFGGKKPALFRGACQACAGDY